MIRLESKERHHTHIEFRTGLLRLITFNMFTFFFFFFLLLLFTTILSQWDFSFGKFGLLFPGESQVRQSRATQPTVHAGCFHNPPNSDVNYRIFNVRTDVNACDWTGGVRTLVRECALKVDSGRKIPRRTGESNLRQRRDGPMLSPTELHPHHYGYISNPLTCPVTVKTDTLLTVQSLQLPSSTHEMVNWT